MSGSSVHVTEFRASGGHIGEYLSVLADLPDENGNQCAYSGDGNTVRIRTRSRVTDTSMYAIAPADDEVPDGKTRLYPLSGTFDIRRSIIGKPTTVIVKGTKTDTGETGNGTPIMMALTDIDSLRGVYPTDTDEVRVSSSSNDYVSIAREAYGYVTRNRSKDWEGVVTVSGTYPFLVGEYGGVPVSVTDSRYGIHDVAMRVREVSVDYSNMTTAITLNNYGPRMNNPIRDSETMGLRTANLSVDNLSLDNYTLQYAVIDALTNPPIQTTGNIMRVRIRGQGGEEKIAETPVDAIVEFPELQTGIVHATFPPGGVYENVNPHAVEAVQVNNSAWMSIPELRRPDKKASQTLIINVRYPV